MSASFRCFCPGSRRVIHYIGYGHGRLFCLSSHVLDCIGPALDRDETDAVSDSSDDVEKAFPLEEDEIEAVIGRRAAGTLTRTDKDCLHGLTDMD